MTSIDSFTRQPAQKIRALLVAQFVWIILVCALGAWWLTLAIRQAKRIDALEHAAGIIHSASESYGAQTQRMLLAESITFFILLLLSSATLTWLYWRDVRRTRALQAFFASFTHELRTPLTSIRLQAETISESLPNEGREQALLGRLLEDCLRLESQVDRSLELARIEGGGPVFLSRIESKSVIERIVRNYPGKLELDTALGDYAILADASAVQVIFRNLLENVVRHSQSSNVRVTIKSKQVGNRVNISVQDNGAGHSASSGRIGELFQKGAKSQGAGVGLYLVKMLMKHMGGSIEITQGPGFGISLSFQSADSPGGDTNDG